MNLLYSTVNTLRDRYTPVGSESTFRRTGQLTAGEFIAAGDYLVFKFPSWAWADADTPALRMPYLPPGKQFLVTRHVPCQRRLGDDFAGDAGRCEFVVESKGGGGGGGGCSSDLATAGRDDEDGWLRTGDVSPGSKVRDVRAVDDAGNVTDVLPVEDDVPDMEDEHDDDAIIRNTNADGSYSGRRTYTLYIMYSPYYKTPRMYMMGYQPSGAPLPPHMMMEDIIGDYKDKTVTLEDFPFFGAPAKLASVHPCKHAAVMKSMLDRADAALRLRRAKLRAGLLRAPASGAGPGQGMEGLVDESQSYTPQPKNKEESQQNRDETRAAADQATAAARKALSTFNADKTVVAIAEQVLAAADQTREYADTLVADEWQDVPADDDQEPAIRVDQYLVVFLKFIASVTPGIEHDFTIGV